MKQSLTFRLGDELKITMPQGKPMVWKEMMLAAAQKSRVLEQALPSEADISYMLTMFSPRMSRPDPQEVRKHLGHARAPLDQAQSVACGSAYMALIKSTEPLDIEQAYFLGDALLTIGRMAQNPNRLGEGGIPLSSDQINILKRLSVPANADADSAMAAVDFCGELPCRKEMNNRRGLGNFRTLLGFVQNQQKLGLQ